MKKIEKLTDAQKARLPEFVERWTKIGLSTTPADRSRAEAAVIEIYRIVGLAAPKIVWCGSPLSQGLTRAIVLDKIGASVRDSVGDSVRDSVWDSVWASVRDSVRVSVWDSIGDSVWDSVRDSVMASVGYSVRDSVRASIRDSVRDSVRASVRDSVGASVRASVRASVYGQHESGWLAFYDFFATVCGLREQTEKLSGMLELSKSAGWALPHKNICWISERHNILYRDELGRLHSIEGPACAYPDGWAIYAVHGVRVPEYVVMRPGEITIEKIAAEANVEIRRVLIERYGEARYILDSGMKPVATDDRFGDLYVHRTESGKPLSIVFVTNRTAEPDGTFRRYALPINPDLYNGDAGRIPQAAVASTWRTTKGGRELAFKKWQDYNPVVET